MPGRRPRPWPTCWPEAAAMAPGPSPPDGRPPEGRTSVPCPANWLGCPLPPASPWAGCSSSEPQRRRWPSRAGIRPWTGTGWRRPSALPDWNCPRDAFSSPRSWRLPPRPSWMVPGSRALPPPGAARPARWRSWPGPWPSPPSAPWTKPRWNSPAGPWWCWTAPGASCNSRPAKPTWAGPGWTSPARPPSVRSTERHRWRRP